VPAPGDAAPPRPRSPFFPQVPATRRDAAVWLVLALIGFALGELVAGVVVDVVAGIEGQGGHLGRIQALAAPPEWYIVSGLVGLWVGFFTAPWLASRVRGTGSLLRDVGLRFARADVLGILIGVGGQALVTVVYAPFISHLHNFNAPTTKLTGGSHGGGFVVIAVLTVLAAPFFEELFFRGLLLRALLRFLNPSGRTEGVARAAGLVGAVVLDGLLFGLAHGEMEQLAGLALFGIILAVVAFRTQRLGMNMVAHASFNLVAVLAIVHDGGALIR